MTGAVLSLFLFLVTDSDFANHMEFGTGYAYADFFFKELMANILEGTEYAQDYEEDLEKVDAMGNTMEYRLNMYSPLYFLLESYDGYQTSNVAKYWRIRSGLSQGDTAVTSEINLALALENYESVESVDFETVWGQKHVEAERTGSSIGNFIDWVNSCLCE